MTDRRVLQPAAKGEGIHLKSVLLLCKRCQKDFVLQKEVNGTRIGSSSLGFCGVCNEARAKRAGS